MAVTCCGSSALVGSAGGRLDRYNLQSGIHGGGFYRCLLYTSDAADEGLGVDLGGRRIIKKKIKEGSVEVVGVFVF